MIELRNVTKRYAIHHGRSQREILKGVNLRVEAGERWGILGRNGAGKSTLIRIISGSDRPHSGDVIKNMSVSWPLAFGGTFQGSLTGKDNVRLISRVYDVDYRKTLELVEDFAELGAYLDEPVKSYSSGMASRLAFAISMSIEFDCFLIDEGMSVGDHRFHQKCNVELFEKRGDRAMIIVAHQTDLIRNHCNRAAVLEDGVLRACETVEEAIQIYESM
ncbi:MULTISPECIES: ABC transporter ATP-binding protein [Burkholderia]|uniref:ABC transporter ATP-binding protein n=1 Tax=Burkholderia contaminans TaxID=488447 RepID=A0A2S5DYJ6_9BURK|nr:MULTISPECIES: ABC transporter ATP-binding protein [Burkholderia]EKS9799914.1 ABC transporter ATP-binding protein [Burkholderia cepacia]EKS9806150.1 ABC transporter ATP-binding protein [Burkholderia cepacia]EKS9809568.1 ABC transporter ATP-binding protein [Burkholderia cepacia]EKS9819101.1 ABC transporter ATP-binding protein [Burkholderia cepacia]EKS9826825.1 ABC transporter ATP-binding protein [Burkholderia cepacia]